TVNREQGAAFLVVSHEMAIIRQLCPQVTVMMEGRVAAQGTLDEVARLPAVVAGYQPGVDILQGMSLTVPKGGFVLVIGPNGAGKSTLLKTVFGLLGAHRGGIALEGQA